MVVSVSAALPKCERSTTERCAAICPSIYAALLPGCSFFGGGGGQMTTTTTMSTTTTMPPPPPDDKTYPICALALAIYGISLPPRGTCVCVHENRWAGVSCSPISNFHYLWIVYINPIKMCVYAWTLDYSPHPRHIGFRYSIGKSRIAALILPLQEQR